MAGGSGHLMKMAEREKSKVPRLGHTHPREAAPILLGLREHKPEPRLCSTSPMLGDPV